MLIVGIDVGASFHVAAFAPSLESLHNWKKLETLKFDINRAGFEALRERIEVLAESVGHYSPGQPKTAPSGQHLGHYVRVAMEPTGRCYSETIGHYCERQGWQVNWVENKALHEYRAMMKSPSKSDAMDARLLAHYLFSQHQTRSRPDEHSRALRHLTIELTTVQKARTRAKNQLRQLLKVTYPELNIARNKSLLAVLEHAPSAEQIAAMAFNDLRAALRNAPLAVRLQDTAARSVGFADAHYCQRASQTIRQMRAFDERISAIGKEIDERVERHPDGPIVLSLPGIGPTIAAALIGSYGNVARFSSRAEFKHRLGVAANDRQSGTSINSRTMNRRATKYARTALHLASVACLGPATGPHYFKTYFETHRNDEARGHNRRLMGRLRGKLAEVLYRLLKKRETYNPQAHKETQNGNNGKNDL